MKKVISMFAVGFALMGSVACSSAPKHEEPTQEAIVAPEPMTEEAPVAQQPEADSSKSDLSLGASSSGRGH